MATLVQTYPQQTATVTMLQARPQSASGMLQGTPSNPQYGQQTRRIHRNSYHGLSSSQGSNTYRGQTTGASIQPYAFTSTPALTGLRQQPPHLRQDQRTMSAPPNSNLHTLGGHNGGRMSRYPAPASVSTTTSSSSSDLSGPTTKDDSDIMTAQLATRSRPPSTIMTSNPASAASSGSKPAPDRYRRSANRRAESQSAIQTAAGTSGTTIQSGWNIDFNQNQQLFDGQLAGGLQMPSGAPQALTQTINTGNMARGPRGAFDDSNIRKSSAPEERHNRRRSIHTIDHTYFANDGENKLGDLSYGPFASMSSVGSRPVSSPGTTGKADPLSTRSDFSSTSTAPKRDAATVIAAGANPAPRTLTITGTTTKNQTQSLSVPPRTSSSDATKGATGSTPLSKPPTMSKEPAVTKNNFASNVNAALLAPSKNGDTDSSSPAASKLAALNDTKPSKKPSRLRRAFSFGSAAELRKAAGDTTGTAATERARLRKEQFQSEQDAEQARIAQKQEEGGIGSGIYSGQGNVFGSTDNLSISSTASSASIMIRKMGKGMKKSGRSLVGLFRPKSVVGVPAADAAVPQASVAEISMVTVEAERQRVNVTAVPYDVHGAGTGFPKLERNSIDAAAATRPSASTEGSFDSQRKSILGGEKERAEILAAVKKGILKRSGTDSGHSSPIVHPADKKTPNFGLPQIPHVDDSPASSAPSTPNDDAMGHRRTDSVNLGGEDYFMSPIRFAGNSKSTPATPAAKRNISWKNTTNYHDTWASTEYDRRGEIATCNRLTPVLAQQIKEELNNFKMEMEVHENSKIYTHFF